MRKIAIALTKGGVAKTTTAVGVVFQSTLRPFMSGSRGSSCFSPLVLSKGAAEEAYIQSFRGR